MQDLSTFLYLDWQKWFTILASAEATTSGHLLVLMSRREVHLDSYSARLDKRAALVAKLLRQLQKSQSISMEAIVRQSDVSRRKLQYIIDVNKKPGIMKVETLVMLLHWFETDLQSNLSALTPEELETCNRIKQTLLREESEEVYGTFSQGFIFEKNYLDQVARRLGGHYLSFRKRGSVNRVMVSALEFQPSPTSTYLTWKMTFKEADPKGEVGEPIDEKDYFFHVVDGYAACHENVLTCIGRRRGTNEMHMINLMWNIGSDNQTELYGVQTTHSREEAIARGVILVRQDAIDPSNDHVVNNIISDYHPDQLERIQKRSQVPIRLPKELNFSLCGVSASPDGISAFNPFGVFGRD